jgi:hypothetical protein
LPPSHDYLSNMSTLPKFAIGGSQPENSSSTSNECATIVPSVYQEMLRTAVRNQSGISLEPSTHYTTTLGTLTPENVKHFSEEAQKLHATKQCPTPEMIDPFIGS